jgi:hypothetical protein
MAGRKPIECKACSDGASVIRIDTTNLSAKSYLVLGSSLEMFKTKIERKLSDSDVESIFDRAWRKILEPALRMAKKCDYDLVKTLVKGKGLRS